MKIVDDRMVTTTEIRVRYAETDQMRIVHHSMYFWYFEAARTELLREAGFSYRELETRGVQLPLIEAQCRFIAPARYDDVLLIESSTPVVPSVRYRIDYEVRDKATGALLATGHTIHAFQDTATLRPIRPPACFHFRAD